MKKPFVWGLLLPLLLAGCNSGRPEHSSLPKVKTVSSVSSASSSPAPTPVPGKSPNDVWEFAGTHVHPFAGKLVSYEMKDAKLISITFIPQVALITPTDPVDNPPANHFEKPVFIQVRNDSEESNTLTKSETSLLQKNATYIVQIDPWVVQKKTITGTTLATIYYEKDGEFISLQKNTVFDACGEQGCKRVTALGLIK